MAHSNNKVKTRIQIVSIFSRQLREETQKMERKRGEIERERGYLVGTLKKPFVTNKVKTRIQIISIFLRQLRDARGLGHYVRDLLTRRSERIIS